MPLETAAQLLLAGYSLVPVWGKDPLVSGWTENEFTLEQLQYHFSRGADGVGLRLRQLVDFDCDSEEAAQQCASLNLPPTVSWKSGRGWHYLYALTPEQWGWLRDVRPQWFKFNGVLEVRSGEGSQSVLPPSGGRVWGNSLLEYAPVWLPDIEFLAPPPGEAKPEVELPADYGSRPGDVFNDVADWSDILTPVGCTFVGMREEGGRFVHDWKRPGDTEQRLSMTTGYCQSTGDDDKLYVFTTNFPPFEANHAYSKFEAFARLYHGGDHHAAASVLGNMGYRAAIKAEHFFGAADVSGSDHGVTFDATPGANGHCEQPYPETRPAIVDHLPVPEEWFCFPGFIQTVRDWHLQRSQNYDPLMGTVAGIALMSWALGRRVKLSDDTRPNLTLLVTGEAGSGKSETRNTISHAMEASGFADGLITDAGSAQGVEDQVIDRLNVLLIRDEAQDLLEHATGRNALPHVQMLMSKLKDLYSASKGIYQRRVLAGQTNTTVFEPSVTTLLLGTLRVANNVPREFYNDGFMARILPFFANDNAERNRYPHSHAPPEYVTQTLRFWQGARRVFEEAEQAQEMEGTEPRDLRPTVRVIPVGADAMAELWRVAEKWRDYEKESIERSLRRREQELTCKLALVGAMSESPEREIDLGLVQHANRMVEYFIAAKLSMWENRDFVGAAQLNEEAERVLRSIRRAGKRSFWNLRKSLRIPVKQLRPLLLELVTRGAVDTDATVTPDGERFVKMGTYYRARD